MCAAVIGRQLRQQAVSGRSSGQVLQTQIPFGKNRPRAPSHALIPARPHSPVPPSAGGNLMGTVGSNYPAFVDHNQVEPTVIKFPVQPSSDRLSVTSKLTSGGAINAVVAQREQRALANQLRKLDMQRTSPKLRCTMHCFCVAFKALSGGLVLLLVGTIMSVYGFLMESEQKQLAESGAVGVVLNSEEVNSRIRNLTYTGPVIMGLGGIVIVAALVLTFEVRDTLGIKEPAPNQREDGHLNQINEYNTIRTNKKNSLDRSQLLSSGIENAYHEPQLLVGTQHSNNNNIYNSTNSGNSGGSTTNTNNTFNSMGNASNVAFAGPNSSGAFNTFARLGSGVAPYGNNSAGTLCAGTNNLSNFTTAFSGTGNALHHHLSMAGSSGIGMSSSSKNPLCRFAGSTQHACLKFFCGQSVANGLWKASTFVLLLICILLTTFLLMGNQLNSDNQLPCPSSSTLMGDLKNELNKHNKQTQLTNNMISNHNLLPSLANNKRNNKIGPNDYSSLNKLNTKLYQTVGSNANQVETYERIQLDKVYYKLLHPYSHWNFQMDRTNLGSLLRFNYTFDKMTSRRQNMSLLVYAAKNRLPSSSRYDFVEYIDTPPSLINNELNSGRDELSAIFNPFFNSATTANNASLDSVRTRLSSTDQLETREFLQYLDSGIWFISLINDQNTAVELAFQVKISETTCPLLCSNNGRYVHGECQCDAAFKGKECELSANECEVSDCNGHGYCMDGKCFCYPGYKGDHCKEIDCLDPFCSGHGQCINGMCVCHMGYRSADCSEKVNDICAQNTCSSHGQLDQLGQCICETGWTGLDCSIQKCSLDCGANGSCENNVCVCKPGFSGTQCQDKQCSVHCHLHGQCLNNGTCVCSKGYNGRHCTIDGCANNCNGQGQCVKRTDIWQCECNPSASGEFCEIPIETDCSDKIDNDNDGLIDCADSECCSNPVCAVASESFCLNSPDPLDILLRKQPPALTASFFQRMQFLIEENSVQSYAQKHAFNESRASVIRGQVVDHHGNGLIGVRVGLANQQQPTVGFVITRRNGHFDLMVNGGGAVVLHLLRDPFQPTTQSANVPWNSIVVLDPIQMQLQNNFFKKSFNSTPTSAGRSKLLYFNSPTQTLTTATRQQTAICLDHDYEKMRFIVLNEKCYGSICVNGQLNGLSNSNSGINTNLNNAIVNSKSSGNLNLKTYKNLLGLHGSDTALSVQSGLTASSSLESSYERLSLVEESVKVLGTDLNLVYSSNHADGYLMLVRLQLTPNKVSNNLIFVHVNIKIEGNLIEKKLEAEPNLIYNFGWDKRNVYRQKVYGLTNALINVGFEYLHCDQIIWETKRVQIRANDLPITEVGGLFNLDIHHRYNLQQGIVQKGNGENLYLNQMNPTMIGTILGDGTQRPLHCTYCNGDLNLSPTPSDQNNNYQNEAHKRLLAPVALASSNDGCIFVGDFNLIRKINLRTGKITTIIELNSSQVAYKYHLTVSPADNRLYFSDPEKYQIFVARSTTLDDPLSEDEPDPRENLELVAGNGIKCLPGDKIHCGDRKPAKQAKLSYPKALAINLMGEIFIADGTNIRYIDTHGIIFTLIGDHLSKGHWRPFPCNTNAQPLLKTHLRWPTELTINPIDNQLYILDDHMVFKLTNDRRLQIVAGRPAHCAKQNDLEGQFESTMDTRNDQFNLTSSFNQNSILNNQQQNAWMPANAVYLETPQAITFTSQGNLLIAESDSQTVNRIRIVLNYRNHQLIGDYVGRHQSNCNCMEMSCDCFDRELNIASNAKLSTISAITVTPNGDLIIADQGNLRIRRVNQNNLPQPVNSNGDYEILSASTNEIYLFNKYGQHMQTKSSLNKNMIYSFTYNVNNSFGKLSSVTESENSKKLNFLRDPHGQVKMIESNSNNNLKINLAFNKLRLLSEVNLNNGNLIKFDYHRNTGLLKSRLDRLSNNMERSVVYEYDEFGRLINKNEM